MLCLHLLSVRVCIWPTPTPPSFFPLFPFLSSLPLHTLSPPPSLLCTRHLKHNITELTQQMKETVGGHDEDGRIMDQLSNKLQQERDALKKLTKKDG